MKLSNGKILTGLLAFSMLFSSTNAANITDIETLNNETISITATEDVRFSDINVEGEIKLLKDIPVSFSAADIENTKKVLINLGSDLNANTSYSLISLLGAKGNIDFTIGEYLEGEIANPNFLEGEEGIEKINVVDSRTIELYFSSDLVEDIFEFKILSEIPTESLNSKGDNKLTLDVTQALESSTSYILMVLTLEDVDGVSITFDENLFDFVTPMDLAIAIPQEEKNIAQVEEVPEEPQPEGNVEEVALNSAETPATGTATGLLILFALVLNLAIFARKKFK